MSCVKVRVKKWWWKTYNTIRRGKYEYDWFKFKDVTYGYHGPEYYDGYHMAINTGILNIYIYW